MCLDYQLDLLLEYCDPDLALFLVGRCKNGIVRIRIQGTEATRVVAGVDCVNEPQVSEVVYVYSVLKDHDDPMHSQSDEVTYLSLRSFTALTTVLNESSPMHLS